MLSEEVVHWNLDIASFVLEITRKHLASDDQADLTRCPRYP